LNRGVTIIALMLAISVFPAASIYAWQITQVRPETSSIEFKILVNGQREILVHVPVDVDNGITEEDCELIAEKVFTYIMGDVMHRLDELSVDGYYFEASYTWGFNEGDMGHFFDVSGDVASHTLTITHCR
jgi:hypothetical protein